MTEIQCPVCEYYVDLDELGGDMGLLSALGAVPTGLSREAIELAEQDMAKHLADHTIVEWVTALRMADVYIDKLETGIVAAVEKTKALQAENEILKTRSTMAPPQALQGPQAGPPPQIRPGLGVPPPPPSAAMDPWAFESPRDRQEVARARRKAGLSFVPTDTLIPMIPPGQRAPGQVGRKY